MHNLLSLSINGTPILAPSNIPTGGLSGSGGKLIGFGITLFLISAIILALAFLMYGGFMWMSSGGDKQKVTNARRTIIYAIIGLIICFLSFFIIGLFGAFFQIDLFNLTI